MYFASSVAVPVAPGTPGIGNVTTAFPVSHDTEVSRTFATPSANNVPGVVPSHQVSVVPASAAFAAPCGLAQMRMSRSWTAAGIGVAFPLVGPISAPTVPPVQGEHPLATSTFDHFCPFGRVQEY